jgi:hypothetical protein
MNQPNLSDQNKTNPDPAVTASEQAQTMTPQNVSGSAMLDAHESVGAAQAQGDPVDHPIATNFARTDATGDAKTAGVASANGPFEADQSAEKGQVNLHNNSDTPGSDLQGTLPNTDPTTLPIDPNTNHQE